MTSNRLFIAILIAVLLAPAAHAGWEIVSESGGEPTTTFIGPGKLMTLAPDQIMILDVAAGILTFAHPEQRTYWRGTPAEFAEGAKMNEAAIERMLARELAEVPADQRAEMERKLREQVAEQTGGPAPTVTVTATDRTDTVAGHSVKHFEVRVNDQRKLDQWVAPEIRAGSLIDLDRYGEMMRTFQSTLGNSEEAALSDPDVINILKTGWPLKTIHYDQYGYPEATTVTRVKETDLPEGTFTLPPDFRRIDSDEIFGG